MAILDYKYNIRLVNQHPDRKRWRKHFVIVAFTSLAVDIFVKEAFVHRNPGFIVSL